MKFNVTFFSVIFVLLINHAQAKNRLTFLEAHALMIKNNLELQASMASVKAAQEERKGARGAFLPEASISLGHEKISSENSSGFTSSDDGFFGTLNLGQNLFRGFADSANLRLSEAKLKSEVAALQEIKAQISYDLRIAAANYLYTRDTLALFKDIQKRREENLRMVELRFENGRENKGSVLLSRAYLEEAKLDLLRSENGLQNSTAFLKRILNLDDSEDLELIDGPQLKTDTQYRPDFERLVAKTPAAQRYLASLYSAEATREVNKSAFYPSLSLNASLGKTGGDFFPNDSKRTSISTTLSWSLFDGGVDFYTLNSSKLLVLTAQKKLENQTLELKRLLVQSFLALKESQLSQKVSAAFLEASKVRADIARSKYNNGLFNFDDWDLIENDLINRQKDYAVKLKDLSIAEAEWEKIQGIGVIP